MQPPICVAGTPGDRHSPKGSKGGEEGIHILPQVANQIRSAINGLPAPLRLVAKGHLLEGRPLHQIASDWSWFEWQVAVLNRLALERLCQQLGQVDKWLPTC
jgi:hypothetical protein